MLELEVKKELRLLEVLTMQLESLSFSKSLLWHMEDGDIEEWGNSFVTIFIRMSYWFFVNCTLPSLMDTQAKFILLTGFQCSIIHYGLPGLAFSLIFLKE